MISDQKKKLLHVAKRELKLTDQQYVYVPIEHTGKMSSADPAFTDEDFKKVIDHFKAIGLWVKRADHGTRPIRNVGDLPTPDQLKVIEHLWHDLAHELPQAHMVKFQRGFYEKRLRIPALGPQTRAQANAVIEALKTRVQRAMEAHVQSATTPASSAGLPGPSIFPTEKHHAFGFLPWRGSACSHRSNRARRRS